MFRKRATRVSVLLTVAASTVALVLTVGAQAGRDSGGETLVLRSMGPVALGEVSPDCFGYVADVLSTSGRKIGHVTSCIDSFGDGQVGGFVATGRNIFDLPGGQLTNDFRSRLSGGMDPFADGPLALPDPPGQPDDQLFTFVGDGSVTGGTNRFAHAKGTVMAAGFGVDDSQMQLKWANTIFVLDLHD